jgi:transcriptional regulator with XRE-family HTH domain
MNEPFALLLRTSRLAARLSQESLAEAARISPAAVGAYERGVRLAPHRATLARLADALGLTGTHRAHFMASPRRKLGRPLPAADAAVVELWRSVLEIQSDEQLDSTADAAIELLRPIGDDAELAMCWTVLAERLERAGRSERAGAARNCAEALGYEDGIANMRSA